jgi:hypothetical protein
VEGVPVVAEAPAGQTVTAEPTPAPVPTRVPTAGPAQLTGPAKRELKELPSGSSQVGEVGQELAPREV